MNKLGNCTSTNYFLILLFYSILLCYWPALPTIHRGLEWPQFLNCSLSVCLFVCLIVLCKFSNFLYFNVLYCTVKYYSVPKQYSGVPVRVNWNVTKYRCGSMREWIATIVLWCTLLYCIILYYTVHSTIHQNYSRGTYIIVLKYIGPHHPASLWYGD